VEAHVRVADRLGPGADERVEVGPLRVGRPVCGETRGGRLQRHPYLEEVAHLRGSEPPHERAAVGLELDEPVGRQPLEGLADGPATHPELAGDLDLVQPRAGRHLAVQDAVAKGALDAVAERVAAPGDHRAAVHRRSIRPTVDS
jgi:hypothetical protein